MSNRVNHRPSKRKQKRIEIVKEVLREMYSTERDYIEKNIFLRGMIMEKRITVNEAQYIIDNIIS